ncbi:hypothetical protein KIL84_023108 [Mauremys mutica]|uniref:Uncharacterized protein n=1 Tax=Mauremys mutica TaxID=74926 RepID=A0A9D3WLU0_9SAUR|nr:hypothetical protein KIL84_023108 [Mauremys mutica]
MALEVGMPCCRAGGVIGSWPGHAAGFVTPWQPGQRSLHGRCPDLTRTGSKGACISPCTVTQEAGERAGCFPWEIPSISEVQMDGRGGRKQREELWAGKCSQVASGGLEMDVVGEEKWRREFPMSLQPNALRPCLGACPVWLCECAAAALGNWPGSAELQEPSNGSRVALVSPTLLALSGVHRGKGSSEAWLSVDTFPGLDALRLAFQTHQKQAPALLSLLSSSPELPF